MCKFKQGLKKLLKDEELSEDEKEAVAEELTFMFYTKKVKRLIDKKDTRELYRHREDQRESPLAFLERVWKSEIEHKALHQDQLERIDRDLYVALKGYMPKHHMFTRELLPPKKDRTKRANDICHEVKAA